MSITNVTGSLALLDLVARHGAGLVHDRPGRLQREPKTQKVNDAGAKEKSGTSTDKGQSGKTGKTRTA